jgi:predicted MFS family arabinose efflux permease
MMSFLGDRRFWAIAPISIVSQGIQFAFMFLWLGPWMRDVALFPEEQTGLYLFYASCGVAAGYFLNGVLADLLKRKGWLSWENLYLISGIISTLLLTFIIFGNPLTCALFWPFIMFFSIMSMIAFPLLQKKYKADEAGRVLSLLNLAIFVMSFLLQWLIGAILELYPVVDGHFSPAGYRTGLIVVTILSVVSVVHFYCCKRKTV